MHMHTVCTHIMMYVHAAVLSRQFYELRKTFNDEIAIDERDDTVYL